MTKMTCQPKLSVFLVNGKIGDLFKPNLKIDDLNDIGICT